MGIAKTRLSKQVGILTPKVKPRKKLPEVEIATCCAYEKYCVAKVNGNWHEFFMLKNPPGSPKDKETWGVKSRPTAVCRLCEQPVASLPTKPYVFGDTEHLDDAFMAVG